MTGLSIPAGALWIGSAHPFDLHEAYLSFRRSLYLERKPGSAALFLTADSRYKLWIAGNARPDGRFVARGPARCWPHAQAIDCLDVADYLDAGRNVLAVQVYQPGYSHFAYVHRGAAGLLAWLEIDGETILITDATWRVRRDPSFAENVLRVSIYGSGVEVRDLRQDEAWQRLAYNDAGWDAARPVAPPGGYPWTTLEPRALPHLVEREAPLKLVEFRSGPGPTAADPHAALVEGWRAASAAQTTTGDAGWYYARQEPGQAAMWLFDLGRAYLCQVWVEIQGANGGEELLISYAEKMRDGQIVLSDPQTYCRMRPTDAFTLRPDDQAAEPFLMRGGRYLLFMLAGATDCRLRFHAVVAEYPFAVTRRLQADDPLMQGVIGLCEETFHACLHDGFVDSVWRESSQWLGDALPQALVMAAMSDDVGPLRQVIRMAVQGAYPDGVLPSVLPGEVHAYTVLDYNFSWAELLALDWQLTGDRDFIEAHRPALMRMLECFRLDQAADGLIRSRPGRRLFLDWAPLSRAEPNAVYNLRYLLALQTAAGLAGTLGWAQEDWWAQADALRRAIRAAFRRNGIWYDDREGTTHSQLAAALAILTGAAEKDEAPALLDAIVARSLDLDDDHAPGRMVLASPFMHHYLFQALRRAGREPDVIEIVRRRWGRWVEQGYPTTWENWNVDFPDGSQCHAFSAHPRYHLWRIAQARPDLGLREIVEEKNDG